MQLQRQSNGQRITVTTALGTGGEARVCAVQQDQALVAKLYHRPTDIHGRKLAAMLANPPLEPEAIRQHILIVWPLDLLCTVDGSRRVVGFLMPRVTGMAPIIDFYNPRARRQQRPWFDYYRLHHTARNLAAAVHVLHRRGYVIGDVNTANTFIGDDALVTLVDTDSFQVRDPQNGFVYRCPVGTPEYTPPELQGRDFASVDRGPEHDLFGLTVLIFQLLMEGTHPFAGTLQGRGEPPPLAERITAGWFPYGRQVVPNTATIFRRVLARLWRDGRQSSPSTPARFAPPFDVLHPTLQDLFAHCFADGHINPQARPDALTWRNALDEARDALVTCAANAQHRFGNHLRACPWCTRTALLGGRDPFPSQEAVQRREHLQPVTPSRTVPPLPRTQTSPPRPTPTPPPPPVNTPPRTVPPPPRVQTPSPRPTPAPPPPLSQYWVERLRRKPPHTQTPTPTPPPPPVNTPPPTVPPPPRTQTLSPRPTQTPPPTLVNSVGMQFVRIEAGTFLMGSNDRDALDREKPPHQVRISKAFYLGTYAVTQGQWQAIMGTNPSHFKGDPNLPVESVSWNDMQVFIRQLNAKEGGAMYRLPTEAEWEYAARAGTTTAYSFGDDPRQLSEYAWHRGNSGDKTHPVGQKKPNPWGLYDMYGNVWEWVQDWYGPYTAGTAVDPAGLSTGSDRVRRGGSWRGDAGNCRSADRYSGAPGFRYGGLGLRLLRKVP